MLFDLKGKRRRTVQATYVTLAVLMGAGLVLFGIGSSVNGGLGNLFGGGNGSNTANQTIQKKIDAAERTLRRDPRNQAALANVVTGHYQLATATADPRTSEFTRDSRPELLATTAAWKRYEAAVKKPAPKIANLARDAYSSLAKFDHGAAATADWAGAADATEALTSTKPTAQNYVFLVQYAALAGQTRKADLAGKQAVRLAPKGQRSQVKQAVKQAKAAAQQQTQPGAQPGSGTPTPAPSG